MEAAVCRGRLHHHRGAGEGLDLTAVPPLRLRSQRRHPLHHRTHAPARLLKRMRALEAPLKKFSVESGASCTMARSSFLPINPERTSTPTKTLIRTAPSRRRPSSSCGTKSSPASPCGVTSYADVGCGGGATTVLIADGLARQGSGARAHLGVRHLTPCPHAATAKRELSLCRFLLRRRDLRSRDALSMSSKHVPDPITFLRSVADRCNFIALYTFRWTTPWSTVSSIASRSASNIPDTSSSSMRPWLSTSSPCRASGHSITPIPFGYAAPSGTMTWMQRLAYPVRATMAKISPWLASRTVCGVSLMLVAATPRGVAQLSANPAISTAA